MQPPAFRALKPVYLYPQTTPVRSSRRDQCPYMPTQDTIDVVSMSSEVNVSKVITEEEAQLYDRQIRLWGLESQKRLRAARVLVAGMKGLGCEVAKNLVLAGINSLTMLDHEQLTQEDGESQFLAPTNLVGKNRAGASLQRLQALNPGVQITVDKQHLDLKPAEFFTKNFDVVVVTNYPKDAAVRINKIARDAGIKFFCGGVFGFFGYCFLDLNSHEYVEEAKEVPEGRIEEREEGPSSAKKPKTEESDTKMVKKTIKFVSLESALNVDWTSPVYKGRIRRMDSSAYFLLMALLEFQSREGAFPKAASREADLKLLRRLTVDISQKFELPESVKLLKETEKYLDHVFSELSPVAAIVGGVLSQEIIKTISGKDEPHNNFFLYNPIESAGSVESIGYA